MAKRPGKGDVNNEPLAVSMDTNNQRTHYFIDPAKRRKLATHPRTPNSTPNLLANVFGSVIPGAKSKENDKRSKNDPNKTPFNRLLNNKESAKHVTHRYALYNQVWNYQLDKIEHILGNTNTQLFQDLLGYINKPFIAHNTNINNRRVTNVISSQTYKIPIGFVSLTSNTANNTRILKEFGAFLSRADASSDADLKVINLNSKNCAHTKAASREINRQLLNLKSKSSPNTKKSNSGKSDHASTGTSKETEDTPTADDDDEQDDDDIAEIEEDEEDDNDALVQDEESDAQVLSALQGRISYDLDVLEEWCENYYNRTSTTIADTNLRIVIIVEDADSVSNEVLNQLIKLLHSYSNRLPIHLLMALSSSNVSNWINSNLNNTLRTLIKGVKFQSNDNKDLGYNVLSELFLHHEVTPQAPISLDSRLSSIILNRFENSNNSIDSLIASLKLSHMIYFYQSPLSSLVDPSFVPSQLHIDSLRKLPSFKKLIEFKVHQLSGLRKELRDDRETLKDLYSDSDEVFQSKEKEIDDLRIEIKQLLQNNDKVIRTLQTAKRDFQNYRNSIINAVNLLHKFDPFKKEKFEIYKLITNNQLINSGYLSDCLRSLKHLAADEVLRLVLYIIDSPDIKGSLSELTRDRHISQLQREINNIDFDDPEDAKQEVRNLLTQYFNGNLHLNKKINDNLFNEIFTFDGGVSELEMLRPSKFIEENLDNLMINLIRPSLRSTLELGLNDAKSYLNNDLITNGIVVDKNANRDSLSPMVSNLYNIYKDAPVGINIYDFYIAFKQSLIKRDIIPELTQGLKLAGSDFSEMDKKLFTDTLRALEQSDSSEDEDPLWKKVTFAWFLQSCFELIFFGLLKEKTKGGVLEKGVWKGV